MTLAGQRRFAHGIFTPGNTPDTSVAPRNCRHLEDRVGGIQT
jgi:hypothetical protein